MDDETETKETTETQETQATETAATETVQETEKKHPLEPGGVRFNEVYAEKKALERENALLREQIHKPAEPAKPAIQHYSQEQLQAWLDAGKITSAQMAGQLALQAKELTKQELRAEFKQETRRDSALSEVTQYVTKIPSLRDSSSADFQRVKDAAYEIANEMDLEVADPRVQRRALRETFGSLDKISKTTSARDFDRRHADTHVEQGGGGGKPTETKANPLKGIPQWQIDHWKRLNYTDKQMEEEAPFWRPHRRGA